MYHIYIKLGLIAKEEFRDIVVSTKFIGGKAAAPNKLRIHFKDGSFLDVWLSREGDYSYHWEHRAQRGLIYRWDNAPDHPELNTFPMHFHDGSDKNVKESKLIQNPEKAIKNVLRFVREKLTSWGN